MVSNIQKKDIVQKAALKAWLKSGKKGTIELTTGGGKTFIFLHALYEMPLDWSVEHFFFAEVTDRKLDLIKQIKLYNQIFNRNVLQDYNLHFATYQSACKWKGQKIGLAGYDEIHEAASPVYSKLYYNNHFKAIIGLSATIDKETYYQDIRRSKLDIINDIAPICFTYSLDDGLRDGTSRQLDIYVIYNQLNNNDKTIKAGSKTKVFYQTEKAAYDYWNKSFIKNVGQFIDYSKGSNESEKAYNTRITKAENVKSIKIRNSASRRSKLLYKLPSKIPIVKELLKYVKGKTIIFGNDIDALLEVTKNVVSSRNKPDMNNKIRDDFDTNKIQVIGSFKKLKQGANLESLDNCIIMSYFSKELDLKQRLGRLRDNGTIGKVFIIVTKETQEEVWFDKMFENLNNLNMIYCNDIESCINKIK